MLASGLRSSRKQRLCGWALPDGARSTAGMDGTWLKAIELKMIR
jgi:hypothetical protein